MRHLNAPILEEDRALVVDAAEGRSFQAMLALGALPEESEFPGSAELLFAPLEAVDFPVDCVAHARWVGNREAVARVRRRIVDADNAFSEQLTSAHGPLSFHAEENRQLARELDAYLRSHERPPLLNTAISLAVGAPSREELERRVEALSNRFGTVALYRPLGLQPALFLDHLPRADGGAVRDYADVLTIEQFGALMPIGTHLAGSERGVLIGRTVSGGLRPVKFDVTEASRTGRPPSMLLAGTLGSGKTIAAELLAYQAERRGSLVVDVDPKPDHNLEGLPELAGRVHVIELSGDERYRGLLDPLAVAPEGLREDLASSYLMDLLPQAPPAWETQIRKAVRAAIEERHGPPACGCSTRLARSGDADARAAGEALSVWADSGIGRLAFGDGARARVYAQRPVTTIKARGLSLPAPGVPRADHDQAERLGVATLKLIAAYAMRLVSGDRSVHKVVLFDEAWFLLGQPRRPPAGRPAQPPGPRRERHPDPGDAAARRRRRDREPDRHEADLRAGDRRRGAPRARAARARSRRSRAGRAGARLPPRALPDARHRRPRGRGADRPDLRAPARRSWTPRRRPGRRCGRWPHEAPPRRGLRLGAAARAARRAGRGRQGPRHRRAGEHLAAVAARRRRPGRPLPAERVLAGLPHRYRHHPARRGAADDRAMGGRADLEPDELPGQDGHRPVHVGVLAGPAWRRSGRGRRWGAGAGGRRDHQRLRERHRRGVDGRGDRPGRQLGDLEGAGAAPLHRDRRRARPCPSCSC